MLIDTNTLNTLPDRELASGIAEVIKYGLIRDSQFFEWQEQNMEALLARYEISSSNFFKLKLCTPLYLIDILLIFPKPNKHDDLSFFCHT